VLFECVKQLGVRDRVIVPASVRVDEYVDMLRHNDVSDQADAESLLQYMKPIAYDAFHGIVVEERQTTLAGNRPEVRVARFVISAKMRGNDPEPISSSPPCPKSLSI